MNQKIRRRTFLQGIGASVALPALNIDLPLTPLVQSVEAPKRMAFLFTPNGVSQIQHWTPATIGSGYQMTEILKPLESLKPHFNVLTGLAQDNAAAKGDGPGDHARSAAAWLTGVHPKKTAGSDIQVGVSVDQLAAQAIGDRTKFRSLELGCERGAMAGQCDSGYSCAYSNAISWQTATTPVPKEVNPRLVFERLFGGSDAADAAQTLAKRKKLRKSILDFVLEDANDLKGTLGARDQRKLEEYLTSVREIERRLESTEQGEIPTDLAGIEPPKKGIPRDRGEHIRLMGDMMILAFQADMTRISTFMFANEGSNRPYREIGVSDGHHNVSHHGLEAAKVKAKKEIDIYHAEQLAYILNRMQSIEEEEGGTLLDNSMVVYGGGISDGNRHNHFDLPILMAGNAGGRLQTGQHMKFARMTPMNNLFLSMLDWVGVDCEQLGDSTGQLRGLF